MDSEPAQYVGTADVAQTFGVSVKTVVMWINQGKIKAIQPSGENGKYRIPASEVTRLMAPVADAGHAAPRFLARVALLLVLTVLASVMSWNAPAGTPLALLIAASGWYVIVRLLSAGALATGRHQRAGGGR